MNAVKIKEESNMQKITPKITPFLWFDDKAEEAANFYVSIFKNSKVISVDRFGKDERSPGGNVIVARFQLEGQEFLALNGGPHHKFSEAISFFVNCETQQEVDDLWARLSQGGKSISCGWLKDKYGLVWQIIPAILQKLLQDKDPAKSARVHQAMLKMQKIEIKALKEAYDHA
jgi:predicted 3-demethylubiquinone-9 3-methyltransferase (glyoxalase superfamily)